MGREEDQQVVCAPPPVLLCAIFVLMVFNKYFYYLYSWLFSYIFCLGSSQVWLIVNKSYCHTQLFVVRVVGLMYLGTKHIYIYIYIYIYTCIYTHINAWFPLLMLEGAVVAETIYTACCNYTKVINIAWLASDVIRESLSPTQPLR